MNATNLKVGILSPGDMGGGTGAVLHNNGSEVYTCLAGRSALTRQIAAEAGFTDTASLDELVSKVDLLLSILVPSAALDLAEQVAAAIRRTHASLVYADCNAIAPSTVGQIAKLITQTGATFVDAGIIGGPPIKDSRARFYCSGPDTSSFERLGQHGLNVRVVGPNVGQASGLKMVYAAATKGTIALWTELLVAARAMGLSAALDEEHASNPVAAAEKRTIPGMPHKAHRWVGEMEEIAKTFEDIGMTPLILQGASDMYRFVYSTPLGELSSRDPIPSLEDVIETLAAHLQG
jgi:3-hydroxyisobutyrate dehydrogenase-like beta-hydroxyacid dehydrogenase